MLWLVEGGVGEIMDVGQLVVRMGWAMVVVDRTFASPGHIPVAPAGYQLAIVSVTDL